MADRRGAELTVHVADAATGTLLRFQTPTLIEQLAHLADFQGVERIRIRVNPNLSGDVVTSAPASAEHGTHSVDKDGTPPRSDDYHRLESALLRLNRQIADRRDSPSGTPDCANPDPERS